MNSSFIIMIITHPKKGEVKAAIKYIKFRKYLAVT